MGIRVDLPLVLAVAAMIVRYVKGLRTMTCASTKWSAPLLMCWPKVQRIRISPLIPKQAIRT